ncbi:hypothetical protein N0V90_011096 [Kalmusia sp. IMI 367209]|nr:hypothetical protein N0V90_011096 [Kalmusia sp. IMI 367209]
MAKTWLPNPLNPGNAARPNLNARGISNHDSVHCYMNSTLQALLHTPIFLHWIRTHVDHERGSRCAKCNMKSLVELYWGPQDPTGHPLNAKPLRQIKKMLFALDDAYGNTEENGAEFKRYEQNDADAFFEWLCAELGEGGDKAWEDQYDAMFRLYLLPWDKCRHCGIEVESVLSNEINLSVAVDTQNTTIQQAIHDHFTHDRIHDSQCYSEKCKGTTKSKDRRLVIEAAPQVLRVTLKIFSINPETYELEKSKHTLQFGEDLDLTQYQQHAAVPLNYRLASVISHNGLGLDSGHYISSVRSPGNAPFYLISDDNVRPFTLQEFTSNPQRLTNGRRAAKFRAYVLTYIRDDNSLQASLSALQDNRLLKELAWGMKE